MKTRTLLEAIGAALLLLPWYLPFIAPSNLPVYHHGLPVTNLIDGLLLDLLVVAVLANFGVLVAIQHLPAAVKRISLAMFAGFMLYRIADIAIKAWVVTPATRNFQYFARWNSVRNQCCIVVLLLSSRLRTFARASLSLLCARSVLSSRRLPSLHCGFSPQLLHVALVHAPVEVVASTHPPPSASSGPNRRIVWILYDGLSYDQTFDHLAPGMKFPNFDRLRNQSVSFSNLYPVGFFTDRVVPRPCSWAAPALIRFVEHC